MTRRPSPENSRRGFSLIELLVVISIIVMLLSLIAPAIQAARRAARRAECLNNMRNVGTAILNVSASSGGELPPLASTMEISNAAGTGQLAVGWPIAILPALENAALLRNIKNDAAINGGVATMSSAENVWLQVYTCPDDSDSHRRAGGLSYVVNAGFISAEVWGAPESPTFFHQPYLINWKGSTTPPYRSTDGTAATGSPSEADLQVALATGVFWKSIPGQTPTYRTSVDYVAVGDGTSTTLMVTENLNAGPWFGTGVNSLGFGIRVPVDTTTGSPRVGVSSPCGEFTTASSLNSDFPCSTFVASSGGSLINQTVNFTVAIPPAPPPASSTPANAGGCDDDGGGGGGGTTTTTSTGPRPSSLHPGGVNAIMVDGSGRFLSESIDAFVYARLITSNGVTFGEKALDQSAF